MCWKRIQRNFRSQLSWSTSGRTITQYWTSKKSLPPECPIDWPIIGNALKSVPSQRHLWIVKHTSGRSAVGIEMHRRKRWTHSQCPRCSVPLEDSQHVVRCPDADAVVEWSKSLRKLRLWLLQTTSLELSRATHRRLSAWHSGIPDHYSSTQYSTLVRQALEAQDAMGWNLFIDGFISTSWCLAHQGYLSSISSPASLSRWGSSLLQQP